LEYDKLSTQDPEILLAEFMEKGVSDIDESFYINDLEPPAFKCVPELAKLKQELQSVEGFQHVMMSGSGTSIFCIGRPVDEAAFQQNFKERDDLLVFQTQFINRPDESVWYERP
jgi:4-diphosphocytidyl-2-C-methyl-D-erythritol kinase